MQIFKTINRPACPQCQRLAADDAGGHLAKLMRRIDKAGRGIVLLHDTKAQTASMLPALLRAPGAATASSLWSRPPAGKS